MNKTHMNNISRHRWVEIGIHVLGWGIVFGFPFLMMSRNGFNISMADYLRHGCAVPLSFLVAFYLNFCLLIPRYLFNGRIKQFFFFNLLLIGALTLGTHVWHLLSLQPVDPNAGEHRHGPPMWIIITRDIVTMTLTIGLSVAIRMSGHWMQIETARREAEKKQAEAERARTEAELLNLRNQLNPHFLLNTLNNIYALIAFDADRAQNAVQELSRLLRHVLYDTRQPFVPLNQEMNFLRNYIELMRIRIVSSVEITTTIDVSDNSATSIAPLIFISLIENAFKHGIAPTAKSYIHINISETPTAIACDIRNSYHPKTQADKSGSGIGLEQVRKRLELTYPGRYSWQKGLVRNGEEYFSILCIQKECTAPNSPIPHPYKEESL